MTAPGSAAVSPAAHPGTAHRFDHMVAGHRCGGDIAIERSVLIAVLNGWRDGDYQPIPDQDVIEINDGRARS
ncbi:MAG: hypothetical protein J0G95_07885 [Rhizobiales bacterium]|nr:hypothetical protein [Hyphomicrobiales bacterium]